MAIGYKSAGAGASQNANAAALNLPCPATVDAGDILIAHVVHVNNTTAPTTPGGGWELLFGPSNLGTGTPTARAWAFGKIADGTEDGANVSFGTTGGTSGRFGRIYSFSGRTSGTILQLAPAASFAENSSETDPVIQSVTTTVAGARAIALVSQDDDNTHDELGSVTGGTWAEPVADYLPNATAVPSQGGAMQLQVGTPSSDPGTIEGGTVAGTNDEANTICFQLLPAPPVTSKTINPATETDSGGRLAVNTTLVDIEPALEVDSTNTIVAFQPFPAAETDAAVALDYQLARAPVDIVPAATTDDAVALDVDKTILKTVTLAAETDAAQTVSFSQASTYSIAAALETEAAQPVTFLNTYAIGPATETDLANSVVPLAAMPAAETDAAQALSFELVSPGYDITPAAETSSGQPLDIDKSAALAAAVEADAAQPVTYAQASDYDIAPALEADTAVALTFTKTIFETVGVVAETDTAQAVSYAQAGTYTITPALEADTAQPVATLSQYDILPATETDLAGTIVPLAALPASETDSAVALTYEFGTATHVDLAPALETNAAQAVDADKHVTLREFVATPPLPYNMIPAVGDVSEAVALDYEITGPAEHTINPAIETDSAQTLSTFGTYSINPAVETDTGQTVTYDKTIHETLVPADETDSAQTLNITKTIYKTVTLAAETDEAQGLTYAQAGSYTIARASETDLAVAVTFVKTIFKTLTVAAETDTAVALTAGQYHSIAPALETDVGTSLTSSSTVNVAFAVETDTARTVAVVKPIHKTIGAATETDIARFLGVGGVFAFTHAATTDLAVALVYGHLQPAGTLGGTATGRLGRIHVGRVTKPRQGVLA